MPQETTWPREPHTAAKHEILRRYLGAWFTILGRKNSRLVYVDGFCGPGRYTGGEPGSPLVAVDVIQSLPDTFLAKAELVFIDDRADRIENLQLELQSKRSRRFAARAICGRFRDEFPEIFDTIVDSANPFELTPPLFAFIDPFGFAGIPFDLVERILSLDRSEAFVLLNTKALRRYLEHPSEVILSHIGDAFGTPEVFEIETQGAGRLVDLRELYLRQLKSCARFVIYFEMLDRNGSDIYHLFFATNNSLGLEKMKDAMWSVDQTGTFRFSDGTDPKQMIMMVPDANVELATKMTSHFADRIVVAEEVKRWINEETIYLGRHATSALKHAETTGLITVDGRKRDGSRRRPNTFPVGSLIRFAGG